MILTSSHPSYQAYSKHRETLGKENELLRPGVCAQSGVVAYAASKGGIKALSRALAVDHARDGIRVNLVCPGSVDTPMLRWAAGVFGGRNEEDLVREWGRSHPLGRVAGAAEVAEVIAFLAGSSSSFVTGTETRVDGGLLATVPVVLPDQTAG